MQSKLARHTQKKVLQQPKELASMRPPVSVRVKILLIKHWVQAEMPGETKCYQNLKP